MVTKGQLMADGVGVVGGGCVWRRRPMIEEPSGNTEFTALARLWAGVIARHPDRSNGRLLAFLR